MEEEAKADGMDAPEQERRTIPCCAMDEEATLLLVDHGTRVGCRIVELSTDGCRMKSGGRLLSGKQLRVEAAFRVRGVAFRFSGVTEWTDGTGLFGVRFVDIPIRRRDELVEVLRELESDSGAAGATGAAEQPVPTAEVAVRQPSLKASAGPAKGERRTQSRHEVDTSAVICLVNVGSRLSGRILDLSLGGCRISTEQRFPVGIYTRVEAEFRLQGLPFRLGGVIQAIHNRNLVGIRFLDVSERKRDQLEQLIEEVEEMQAKRIGAGP